MELCGDEDMADLVRQIQAGEEAELDAVDAMLRRFPQDPRLHFMRGSILAGRKQHADAHGALARAVELAPDFHIARYQLGFFELTSGEVDQALSTWGPLMRLPHDAYLRKFAEGLTHLVRDEFEQAIELMREGIALNRENEPLNQDIRLLMAECEKAASGETPASGEASDLSATSVILGQFSGNPTRH